MLDSLLRSWGKLVVAVGAMGVAFALSPAAHAATINFASFSIGGSFSLPAGMHLGNTDTIFIGNGGSITVTQGDVGDLAGIVNDGDTGTLADLPSLSSFAPIGGYLSLGGGVSLDLNSIQITDRSGPTPGLIEILGDGVVQAALDHIECQRAADIEECNEGGDLDHREKNRAQRYMVTKQTNHKQPRSPRGAAFSLMMF